MTVLYVVRHGQTAWNVEGRLQGTADQPLNEAGREQAKRCARLLADAISGPVTIVSSPLSRACDTAAAIAGALGAAVELDERLVERTYGVWEGLTWDERVALDAVQAQRWLERKEPHVEGYEPHLAVERRMRAALDDWLPRAVPGDLMFVTHGSSARMLTLSLLGLPLDSDILTGLGNAAWSELVRAADGGWALGRHNAGLVD